jgi:hypothetical protein
VCTVTAAERSAAARRAELGGRDGERARSAARRERVATG